MKLIVSVLFAVMMTAMLCACGAAIESRCIGKWEEIYGGVLCCEAQSITIYLEMVE